MWHIMLYIYLLYLKIVFQWNWTKTIDVNPTFTLKSKIKMNQARVLLSNDLLNCIFMLWDKRFWRSSHVSNWPLLLRYIQDPSSCSTASGSCWWCAAYVRPTTYSIINIGTFWGQWFQPVLLAIYASTIWWLNSLQLRKKYRLKLRGILSW